MQQVLYTYYLIDNPEGQIILSPLCRWEKLMFREIKQWLRMTYLFFLDIITYRTVLNSKKTESQLLNLSPVKWG